MTKQQSAKALAEAQETIEELKSQLETSKKEAQIEVESLTETIEELKSQLETSKKEAQIEVEKQVLDDKEKTKVILLCNYGGAMANTEFALPTSRAKNLIDNGLAKEVK